MAIHDLIMAAAGVPTVVSPLSYVGSATGSSTSGNNFNISLTALSGGVALAPSQNDIVIVVTAVGDDAPCTVGSYTQAALVSTLNSTLWVGYKFMGATPDTAVTVLGSGQASQGACGIAYVWRGVHLTTPMDATATTSSSTTSAIADPPSITPVTSGAVVLAMGGAGHTAGAPGFTASGLSNFRSANANTTSGTDATVGIGWASWSSGALNPAAFTFGATDSTAYMSCGATLALRPA